MSKNSKSNKKHTWTNSVAIAHFLAIFSLPSEDNSQIKILFFLLVPSSFSSLSRLQYMLLPPLLFLFSPIYIIPQDLNLFPKRRIFLFPFFFSSLFLNLPIKSNLPNFKFPTKTFQGESRLP